MIGVGLIGYGYWGTNLARNFAEVPSCQLVAVSDLDPGLLALAHRRFPMIEPTSDYRALIENPRVDAVAIATKLSTHFDLAMEALRAGKHVFVEKPMAATSEQASRLIDEAKRSNLVLMVDHTFVYTGAVRKIRELIHEGQIGRFHYFDSVRVNLGIFQPDVDVVWDLAVHDLSIMDYALPSRPRSVLATGTSQVPGGRTSVAYLTLFFDDDSIGHVHVSWLAPVKLRRTLIGGSEKMIVYDAVAGSEQIKVYDKGITVTEDPEKLYQRMVGYREGDMWAPQVDLTEALASGTRHFADCIERSAVPTTDGEVGLRMVRYLEAASRSLENGSRPVDLETGALSE